MEEMNIVVFQNRVFSIRAMLRLAVPSLANVDRPRRWGTSLSTVMVWGCFLMVFVGVGDLQGQESSTASRQDGKADEVMSFRELVATVQKNEAEVNRLYTTMPIGFPDEQEQFFDQIAKLKSENTILTSQMHASALMSFRAAPNQDPQVLQIVFQLVMAKNDGKNPRVPFDPLGALEIATTMLENGIESPNVMYQAFRASYAIHDFAQSHEMFDRIQRSGTKLSAEIYTHLTNTETKWKQELSIRKQEEAADDLPRVKFETTDGEFVVELFENEAPQTVGNFISLVESGFYDNLVFYLVIPGLYSQTGCPLGDGTGDAGYKIPDEFSAEHARHHFGGSLSMSNSGKDTGSSHFMICHQPNENYDGNHTVFGRVLDGFTKIYQQGAIDKTKPNNLAQEPCRILKATVVRKRDHAYTPTRIANPATTFSLPGGLPTDSKLKAKSSVPNVAPGG